MKISEHLELDSKPPHCQVSPLEHVPQGSKSTQRTNKRKPDFRRLKSERIEVSAAPEYRHQLEDTAAQHGGPSNTARRTSESSPQAKAPCVSFRQKFEAFLSSKKARFGQQHLPKGSLGLRPSKRRTGVPESLDSPFRRELSIARSINDNLGFTLDSVKAKSQLGVEGLAGVRSQGRGELRMAKLVLEGRPGQPDNAFNANLFQKTGSRAWVDEAVSVESGRANASPDKSGANERDSHTKSTSQNNTKMESVKRAAIEKIKSQILEIENLGLSTFQLLKASEVPATDRCLNSSTFFSKSANANDSDCRSGRGGAHQEEGLSIKKRHLKPSLGSKTGKANWDFTNPREEASARQGIAVPGDVQQGQVEVGGNAWWRENDSCLELDQMDSLCLYKANTWTEGGTARKGQGLKTSEKRSVTRGQNENDDGPLAKSQNESLVADKDCLSRSYLRDRKSCFKRSSRGQDVSIDSACVREVGSRVDSSMSSSLCGQVKHQLEDSRSRWGTTGPCEDTGASQSVAWADSPSLPDQVNACRKAMVHFCDGLLQAQKDYNEKLNVQMEFHEQITLRAHSLKESSSARTETFLKTPEFLSKVLLTYDRVIPLNEKKRESLALKLHRMRAILSALDERWAPLSDGAKRELEGLIREFRRECVLLQLPDRIKVDSNFKKITLILEELRQGKTRGSANDSASSRAPTTWLQSDLAVSQRTEREVGSAKRSAKDSANPGVLELVDSIRRKYQLTGQPVKQNQSVNDAGQWTQPSQCTRITSLNGWQGVRISTRVGEGFPSVDLIPVVRGAEGRRTRR